MTSNKKKLMAALGSAHHIRPQRVGGDSDYAFTLQTILIV